MSESTGFACEMKQEKAYKRCKMKEHKFIIILNLPKIVRFDITFVNVK